jgi:hypothetical protein
LARNYFTGSLSFRERHRFPINDLVQPHAHSGEIALGILVPRNLLRLQPVPQGVAIAFLLCVIVLLSQILALAWQAVQRWNSRRLCINHCRKRLQQLTGDEKLVLQGYVHGQTRTQYLDLNDGVVAGLVAARVLYRATTISRSYTTFAYNISDVAWDYLHEHPEVLSQ